MRKMTALAKALCTLPGIRRADLDIWADDGTLHRTGRDLGHGLEIGQFAYGAVVDISRCPESIANTLLAFVSAWLSVHDPGREAQDLPDPEIDISVEDEEHASVVIEIAFRESIEIVEDMAGPILFAGKRWRVADVPVDVACAGMLQPGDPDGD